MIIMRGTQNSGSEREKITSDCKVIRIIQGEEYKEKLEPDIREDDFFYQAYNEANSILDSIIRQQRKEESLLYRDYNAYDMYVRENNRSIDRGHINNRLIDRMHINNIITFNADRGQGKTSALHTFAQYLNRYYGHDEPDSGLFDKKIESGFEILPIIDPTELNSGESVIRIFVAQLFKVYQDISENLNTNIDIKVKRYDIVELFQKCYDNINYIQGKKDKNEWTDDLESLMKLGNVSEIKENLKQLIDKVLSLQSIERPGEKYKRLVVRIDDTDLCMSDAFSICEDIREYLSLPNVVILMALDIRQLKYAIFQRYLMKYKGILGLSNDEDYYKKSVLTKCDYMASRYIEKMFPSGYVVDLPKIDELVKKNYSSIKIDYKISKDDELVDVETSDAYKSSKDLHEQLLNLLYTRTGIIVNRKKDRVHFLLPVSMRELNHFLRLLSDMKPVNFNELYALQDIDINTSADMDDIVERALVQKENLTDNLHRLERYYLNYCNPNRLGEELSNEFIEIADSDDVYYNLGELIKRKFQAGKNDRKKWEYSDIVHFLYEQSYSTLLTESIEVFLDIILHETLISVLDKKDERKKFSSQFRHAIDWNEKYDNTTIATPKKDNNNGKYRYKCLKFDIKKADFKDIFYNDKSEKEMFSIPVKTNINTFCYAFNPENDEIDFMENDEKSSYINDNVKEGGFSILKAFDGFFNLTSSGFSSDDGNFIVRLYDLYMNVAITLDVIQTIKELYTSYMKDVEFDRWDDIVSQIYTSIDENINDHFEYLKLYYKVGNEINKIFNEESKLKQLFLRNKDNGGQVLEAYTDEIGKIKGKALKLIEDFKDIPDIAHSGNMSNAYELKELSKKCRAIHPFVEVAGTKHNTYEGEIDASEKKAEKLGGIIDNFTKYVDYSDADRVREFEMNRDKIIDVHILAIKSINLGSEYNNNKNSNNNKKNKTKNRRH